MRIKDSRGVDVSIILKLTFIQLKMKECEVGVLKSLQRSESNLSKSDVL